MLEFSKKELEFSIEGEVYKMPFPSALELEEYGLNLKDEETKFSTHSVELFIKLGLDKKVAKALSLEAIIGIMQALQPDVKKN